MSKNRSYLEQIDEEIAEHRKALEELQIARQVIARLAGNGGGGSGKAETTATADKAPASGITIRRVAPATTPAPQGKAEKAVAKKTTLPAGRSPERKAQKALIREQVVEQLKSEPLSSTTLINRLLPADADKSDKQTIYDALYLLKAAGTLKRDSDALYHMVEEPRQQQATSH